MPPQDLPRRILRYRIHELYATFQPFVPGLSRLDESIDGLRNALSVVLTLR